VALLVVQSGYRMPGSVIRQLCGDMIISSEELSTLFIIKNELASPQLRLESDYAHSDSDSSFTPE
jgi:hypothetical protein